MNKRGFTIVELLIVIVVIAILAAISIVAFNGVQARASYTKNAAQLDEIGKSIRLYRANGGSMTDGVAGATGTWYGGGQSVYAGTTKSMRDALIENGYLSSASNPYFMVAHCTNSSTDQRRVVLGKFDPIPTNTVAEQIAEHTCSSGSLTGYTDPTQQYKMNIGRVF